MSGELARAREFTLANDEAAADRVQSWSHGVAVITPSLPELWDTNYLRVDRPNGLDAGALAAEAHVVLGRAGANHRAVVVPDGPAAEPLQAGFAALGWGRDRLAFLVLRGTPRPRPGTPPVVELDQEEVGALNRELAMAEPFSGAEVARQVAERHRRMRETARLTWFAAGEERRAASCGLLQRDGIAEIEGVSTLPAHRGRGLGRAVVVAAARAARERGAELVFLGAFRDDWPHDWYRRLGFEPVGMLVRFRRTGPAD